MRVKIDELTITVEAEATEEIPAVYSAMHIIYTFKGEGLDERKLAKAVQLSHDKYCGVSMMYGKFLKISWEIKIAV
jgi:putative redox protein